MNREITKLYQAERNKQTTPVISHSQLSSYDNTSKQSDQIITSQQNIKIGVQSQNKLTLKPQPKKKVVVQGSFTVKKQKEKCIQNNHKKSNQSYSNQIFKKEQVSALTLTQGQNSRSNQAIINALQHLNMQISDGPQISINDSSSQDQVYDDNSDTFIQQESLREASRRQSLQKSNAKQIHNSLVRNKNISAMNSQVKKKNKGSFMIQNTNRDLESIISTNQKYLSLKKPTNINIPENFGEQSSTIKQTPKNLFKIYDYSKIPDNLRQAQTCKHHQTNVPTNLSKIEKANSSQDGITIEINNGKQISIQDLTQKSQQRVNQVYNSTVITKIIQESQSQQQYQTSNALMFNVKTPTSANKQQFQSPNLLSTKSASQSDLRSGVKKQESQQKVRTQQVRELSVKRSILAQEKKMMPIKNMVTQNSQYQQQSPYQNKRLGSFDGTSSLNSKRNKILINQMNILQSQKMAQNKIIVTENFDQNEKLFTLTDNIDENCNIQIDHFTTVKLRGSTFKNPPHFFEPVKEEHFQENDDKSGIILKSEACESIPTLDNPIITNNEPQISLLNKFKNFFKRNIQQETKQQTQQEEKSLILPQKLQNNMICTDLQSPIMEEKLIDLNIDNKKNNCKIDRIEYFKQETNFICSCPKKEGINYACVRGLSWLQTLTKSTELDCNMKELYSKLITCKELSDYEDQIDKDTARTFPQCQYFQEQQGQDSLKRVLLAFSRYDTTLGYVQGMNFIVGSMLYHCNEEVAFWLFVSLIEGFEMRDIYEHGLPGLYKHCFIIDKLIEKYLPDLYNHFVEHDIAVEMYGADWIFCLFSSIIPIQIMGDFFDQFFTQGWTFFYKFCLSMLGVFKNRLLEEDEFSGILSHIKFKTPEKKHDLEFQMYNQIESPKTENKVFIFDEQTQTFTKQSIVQSSKQESRLRKFIRFLLGKQEGIWFKIFNMCSQWQINDDLIKSILSQYKLNQPSQNPDEDEVKI